MVFDSNLELFIFNSKMYDGVGLSTARGSGTNGHVQRNLASKPKREKTKHSVESTEELVFKEPNKEILEHARKREIEVKCIELSDTLEDQGCTQEEIDTKVAAYRKVMLENYERSKQADI